MQLSHKGRIILVIFFNMIVHVFKKFTQLTNIHPIWNRDEGKNRMDQESNTAKPDPRRNFPGKQKMRPISLNHFQPLEHLIDF